MPDMIDADQWLSDGDCDICRRKKYCKNECKAHKTSIQRSLQPQTNGALKALLNAITSTTKQND
jgi:radical SAM protein with 4Fe4S-binding SPASM domain